MRKTTLVFLLAFAAAALACGAASATVHIGRLAIADQPFHSTMHVIEGSFPKFTADAPDGGLADRLNDFAGRFYDEVMTTANPRKSGGPYPPVRFAYDVFDSGRYLSVLLHGSVSEGSAQSHLVRALVLDRGTYRILSLRDILGDDAYSRAERFIGDEIRRNPSRYLRNAKSPKIGDDVSFYVNGRGDLVFIFDKHEIVYPAKDFSGRASPHSSISRPSLVSGRILDASMNTIVMQTDDGRRLSFSTVDADTSGSRGLLIGSRVEIYYTGTIEGTDTSKISIVYIRQPKER